MDSVATATGAAVQCPQCGWGFDDEALRTNICKKCQCAIIVTSIAYLERFEKPAIQKYIAQYSQTLRQSPQDREALLGIGICYLRVSLYDLASRFISQLVQSHPEDPSGYLYQAIVVLKGKRPKLATLPVIREAERFLSTAMELSPVDGTYDIVLAAIRHDYYILNGMRVPSPAPADLLAGSSAKRVDEAESRQLLRLLGVSTGPVAERLGS